ncbi:MAG: phage tail tape measure protein [Neorhizobium sp.]|nr:phage tail tape measure protein [Neorhizobium sp.]
MAETDTDFSETLSGADALSAVMADLETRSTRFGQALGSALKSATTGGKGLDSVLTGLAGRLADIALSAGLKPLETLAGNAVASLLGAVSGPASGRLSGMGATGVTAFADGGIVRAPSYFSMAGGTGLMGEAGAEAILPLQRGPDGALGVATAGGAGDGRSQPIVFNVTATDAASFRRSEGQITAMLARSVARGRRGI